MSASLPALELCGAKTGNCIRAALGLAEAGLPYRVRRVDLRNGEHRSAEFKTLNPAGKVPVLLIHEGSGNVRALTQSSAILFYADELAPGRLLPPKGDESRIRALEAFFFFTSDVIALNGAAFTLSQDHPPASQDLMERATAALSISERFLSESGFMGGAVFTMADIVAFTITSAMSTHLPWQLLPRLARWHESISRRSSVAKTMTIFD